MQNDEKTAGIIKCPPPFDHTSEAMKPIVSTVCSSISLCMRSYRVQEWYPLLTYQLPINWHSNFNSTISGFALMQAARISSICFCLSMV